MKNSKEVLIGPLGFSPQIITITLDALQQEGYHIDDVVSVYTDHAQVKLSLARLADELTHMGNLHHKEVLVTSENGPIYDFLTEADTQAFLRTLYREVKAYKDKGWRVHLSLAGGRRVMSAFVLVVAQLLFDEQDRAWSLFSEFWEKAQNPKMHAGPDDVVTLVPVPVLRWTSLATITADLVLSDDPFQTINYQAELHQREKDQRFRLFLRGLKPAKQEIAHLLAEGLDNKAIAIRRHTSVHTVKKQVSDIFAEWRVFFDLPENTMVRDQIVADLSGYFVRKGDK